MALDNQQQATLKVILTTLEFRDALQAAFDEECARWERISLQATNSDEDVKAKRAAAFAASYKSLMPRLLSLAKVEDEAA